MQRVIAPVGVVPQSSHEVRRVTVTLGEPTVVRLAVIEMIGEHRSRQLLLRGEVRIERATGEARGRRELLDRRGADPLLGKHARCRLEQALAGLLSRRTDTDA